MELGPLISFGRQVDKFLYNLFRVELIAIQRHCKHLGGLKFAYKSKSLKKTCDQGSEEAWYLTGDLLSLRFSHS